jgi:nucleoside-diphosphate-sugar epimerase
MAAMEDFTPASLVLVTGANGHVAQHVLSQLLSRPATSRPKVRATVRSESSSSGLATVFRDHVSSGELEIVRVPDIVAPGAFDDAVRGCTHVAHIASPLVVGAKDVEEDVLVPAVQGTLSLLEAAARSSSVKSVVITSSFAAVFDPAYDLRPGYTYTPADWNPISYEEAADRNLNLDKWPARYRPFITYMASKKLAEKAAWDFYATSKPEWRFSVICPAYIGGPCALPLSKGVESLSFSNQLIWNTAASKPDGPLPQIDFPNWVDVRDVAKAHILALVTPKASGERFILAPSKKSYSDMAAVARERCGMTPSDEQQTLECFDIESENCSKILGITSWVSFDDMVAEVVEQVKASSTG